MNIQETCNQWITCSDVMPDADGWFDVWLSANDRYMDCGAGRQTDVQYIDGAFLWDDDEPINHVTHWMRIEGPNGLPHPPNSVSVDAVRQL